ncbi:Hypothetical predicted protein, partial [Pelobates cultripes]
MARKDKIDVLCVQETHFTHTKVPKFAQQEYPTQYHSTHSSKSRGPSILIHKSLSFELLQVKKDSQGRYVIIHCTINDINYTIASVYSPNTNQRNFLHKVLSKIPSPQLQNLILCGDLNHIFDQTLDTTVPGDTRRQAALKPQCKAMTELLLEYNIYDSWRTTHPNVREYTHHSRAHKTSSRIDHILIAAHLLTSMIDCTIGDLTWSDHAPVRLTLQDKFPFRGTSPWKLHDSLLFDDSFKNTLEKEIKLYFDTNYTPQTQPQNVWLAHKAVIRGLIISRAAYLKRKARDEYTTLLKKLRDQTNAHLLSPSTA